ncbi:hypothetical protein FV232_01090 [Methylobacterium sp. WL30]|uniref:hypothetical protein n=1 Tax=unclassified Methylobacterium TaxID=2615210 RepID=UPI0011C7D317|nr:MULTISPECIES: hypothetical protein [unclassified Methylobacterium]TXN38745.1 hypothetical protein FV225_12640 [Methylobacterium sp. WL93]TXN52239.1 hypothetical protein FV227_04080 [Methylobacterium sp. WL119]TXN70678.1 hypothetical protein FV232_01090 [Methylobacterium sp. WL30]
MSPYTRANLTLAHRRKSLTAQGVRLPVRTGEGALRALVDADGKVFAVLIPTGSAASDHALAETIATAINAGCGVPAPDVAAPLDPHHVAAVRAESRQQAERMNRGRLPDAAE